MRHDDPAFRRFILSAVPSVAGWRTAWRTWINLLLFGLVVLAGTWTVHQVEYAIVYGHRFGAVMAATPHRFYMGPLGVFLAIGTLFSGIATLSVLVVGLVRIERIRGRLPARYSRRLAAPFPSVPYRSISCTAALLLALQSGLYLLQENLESFAVVSTWPGMAVLVGPQHWTVLPLHLVIASCSSLVLWMVSAWLQRTRETSRPGPGGALCWTSSPQPSTDRASELRAGSSPARRCAGTACSAISGPRPQRIARVSVAGKGLPGPVNATDLIVPYRSDSC
jgi:hypothetical protein